MSKYIQDNIIWIAMIIMLSNVSQIYWWNFSL